MDTSRNSTKGRVKYSGTWLELENFAQRHPGGPDFIQLMDGRDVTDVFASYHPHLSDSHIRTVLRKVKDESSNDAEKSGMKGKNEANEVTKMHAKEFRELQKEVLASLGGFRKTKGNTAYFLKVLAITILYIASEAMQWIYGFNLYRASVHGIAAALIGMNIMHDAIHGAASINPKINYILATVWTEMIGKSAISFKFSHNFFHHVTPNTEADPDARQSPVLRVHPKDAQSPINKFQHLYIWPLLTLLHFSQGFLSEPIYLATGTNQNDMVNRNAYGNGYLPPLPDSVKKYRLASIFFRFLYYLRFLILPMVYAPEINTVLCIFISTFVTSMVTGPLMIISHNFTGAKFHSNSNEYKPISFMAIQVETACNWGGWLGIQLSGGLNCKYMFYTFFKCLRHSIYHCFIFIQDQIEHHLFPGISHMHYYKIAPIVRRKCEELGIRYIHYPDFQSNVISCYKQLKQMGITNIHDN